MRAIHERCGFYAAWLDLAVYAVELGDAVDVGFVRSGEVLEREVVEEWE